MALDFDGTNDTVSHGDVTGIDGASALTLLCWINPDAVAVRSYLILKTGSFDMRFDSVVGTPLVTLGSPYGFCTSNPVVVDTDQYLGFVFDGSGAANADRLKIYYNGVSQSLTFSGTIPATVPDSTTAAVLVSQSITSFYNGGISNIKMWNAALRADEVVSEMWSYPPKRTTNLIFWAPYDDGVLARDYSGAGFHGTVTEAVSVTGPPGVSHGNSVLAPTRARRATRRSNLDSFRRLGPFVPNYWRGL